MDVVPTLAQGVLMMKKELGASGNDVLNQCPFLQDFLNRFHSSRIGIRLLISQHLAIHQPVPGYIGTIATSISPVNVIRDAISDAARICDRVYGWAPEVDIIGASDSFDINFVPTHLHHICFELIKNSMRAVLEHHGVKNYVSCPFFACHLLLTVLTHLKQYISISIMIIMVFCC
jgi:pyruvate dehydrogenase kinase 2/3/4